MANDTGHVTSTVTRRRGITEEKLIDLMEEDRQAVYQQHYGQSD